MPWRTVDFEHALEQNVFTLQAPPPLLHEALRQTLRAGLELTRDGQDATAVTVDFFCAQFFPICCGPCALSQSTNSISSARLSTAAQATFCHPRRLVSSACSPSLGGGDAPSRSQDSHVGTRQPFMRSACAACSAAATLGGLACTSPPSKCCIKSYQVLQLIVVVCLQCPDRLSPGGRRRSLSVSNCRGQPLTPHSGRQLPSTPALVWEGHGCSPPETNVARHVSTASSCDAANPPLAAGRSVLRGYWQRGAAQ